MNGTQSERPQVSAADAERAAAILEATGNYRVSRRMPEWPMGTPLPGSGLAKVVLLDTETTGLNAKVDRVFEVGMIERYVDVRTGEFVGPARAQFWLEDPGAPLEPHIVELTGRTDADLEGHRFDEAGIGAFLSGAALVIAHSAWHDRPFFEARFPALCGLAWGCSLQQVPWREAGYGSSKLDYLLYQAGMFHDGHQALPDCQALGHVLGLKLPGGGTALQRLIDWAQTKDFKIHANGAPFEKKDALKERGYFWDGDLKVWHTTVDEDRLEEEFAWLYSEVYMGRPARVQVSIISAAGRFTPSPVDGSVVEEIRSIGAQGDSASSGSGRAGRSAGMGHRRY